MRLAAAKVVQSPVFGFQTSADLTASPSLMSTNPPPRVPPVISTCPSGKIVELRCRRGADMEPALCHWAEGWLRSIFSAVAVGVADLRSGVGQPVCPPPPAYRIFPGSYMAAVP